MPALDNRLQQSSAASYALAIAMALAMPAVGGMALLAAGQIGRIELLGAPVDAELVLASVWHSLLGCVLSCVQWGAGAGLALWFCREANPPFGRLLLLGFPLSLVILGVASYLVLALPFGWLAAAAGLMACFAAFLRRPPEREALGRLGRVMLAILPMCVLLGCWMGLLAHGPTEDLPGRPTGDLSFYASSIYSLQVQPFPFVNYANEGETLSGFNMLHSLLGAAVMRFMAIDPFLFVLAAGASMFAFGLGLGLHAYLSLRRDAGIFSYVILVLAAVVATRYPYWVVESPPMIFTLPLTISIWYRATSDRTVTGAFTTLAMAVAGSALSKVTSVMTLAPLSLAPAMGEPRKLVEQFGRLSLLARILTVALAGAVAVYAVFMLYRFGPYMLAAGGIGPESYERYQWATQYHASRRLVVPPYLLRDMGTVLLAVLAFRMLPWMFAAALSAGLAAALTVPYFARVNLYCVAIAIALAGIDHPLLLKKSRTLALAAFLMCLPAILQTDFGGHPSSAVWVLCIGAMVWTVCANARSETETSVLLTPRFARSGAFIFALLGVLTLSAFARQQIVFGGQIEYILVPTEARDVWTAVRERTPRRALIFTDQTGPEPYGALGGWNTYATTGQRQIYLAGWYQSPEFRQSPPLLMERLRLNDSVLYGGMQPAKLQYRRGPYSDYFAVVSRTRMMPSAWRQEYGNGAYALYRYNPNGRKVGP